MRIRSMFSTEWLESLARPAANYATWAMLPTGILLVVYQWSDERATGVLPYAGWLSVVTAVLWGVVVVSSFVYIWSRRSEPRPLIREWFGWLTFVAIMCVFIGAATYCL